MPKSDTFSVAWLCSSVLLAIAHYFIFEQPYFYVIIMTSKISHHLYFSYSEVSSYRSFSPHYTLKLTILKVFFLHSFLYLFFTVNNKWDVYLCPPPVGVIKNKQQMIIFIFSDHNHLIQLKQA